ncbi:hypothetical protein N3873_003043 [Escherichia coli]|uniref:hypothetical protein n=1 Tax=Escherichia coli TaxID=562 RepID=UPI000B3DB686|nr:hypothetical protein [Escherichia coli]EEW1275702.1 hypothetical protein [Escherichia coli]EEY4087817.1 hypothetical protein [Escherichia coli]EFA5252284.1 hypothetical protein [Escherichia coli]EFB4334205.1 hypothetical protein [Escherichia coli]EFC1935947.1 hypothetical protein [Escherichia coli]
MTPEQNRALPAHQETDPGYYPVVELAQGAFLPEQTQSNHQRRAWRAPDSRSERELMAIDRALKHILSSGIKPVLTVQEFSEFFGQSLRKVQSDAERGYLPLVPRVDPNRRELRQINMVAWYARAFMTAEASLTKTTAFN